MTSLISIYAAGVLTILMAVFHTLFHRLFKWEAENRKLTAVNQKIFFTIHLALLLFFFGTGIFTLLYAHELSRSTGVSFGINLILALFWLWRTIWQIIYFKGKVMRRTSQIFLRGFHHPRREVRKDDIPAFRNSVNIFDPKLGGATA